MTENSQQNPSNLTLPSPQIYKEEDFKMMLELIRNGLYRDTNLAAALHIDRSTIAIWKKRPEAIDAHRQAILKFSRKRTDVDKILRELEVEVEPDSPLLVQQNNYLNLTDGQLNTLIDSKIKQIGASVPPRGETAPNETRADEVRQTTPETT